MSQLVSCPAGRPVKIERAVIDAVLQAAATQSERDPQHDGVFEASIVLHGYWDDVEAGYDKADKPLLTAAILELAAKCTSILAEELS